MLGHQRSVRFAALLVLSIACGIPNAFSVAQDGSSNASVEQLTAMLQSIDPYRPSAEVTETVQVFGSTSMDALAHGWANGFRQFHPKAKVEISAAGSEESGARLLTHPGAIALFSRPVTEEELAELRKQGLKNPTAFVVAREALSVFVHSSNPAATISGEQLREVFTADSQSAPPTWGNLGVGGTWAQQPIHIIARSEKSGTQKFLSDFVFRSAQLRPSVSAFTSNAEVLRALQKDPLAIAICGYRSTGNQIKALQLMSGNTAIACDDHAILAGRYPLTRPMSAVIDMGQTNKQAIASQELIRYALCQSGQTQAMLVGLFPVDLPLLRASMERLDSNHIR